MSNSLFISPPNDTAHTFDTNTSQPPHTSYSTAASQKEKQTATSSEVSSPSEMISPPITPFKKGDAMPQEGPAGPDNELAGSSKDPILFPIDQRPQETSDVPLFGPDISVLAQRKTLATEKQGTRRARPRKICGRSRVIEGFNRDPRAWLEFENKQLERMYGKPVGRATNAKSKKSSPKTKVIQAKASGVQKPQHTMRTRKSTTQEPAEKPSPITPVKAAPKPRVIGTNRDVTDYRSIVDYSPPISTLDTAKGFKAEWKGQMLDLSEDPDREILHRDELTLAATLRLSCNSYLCNKRRIFVACINSFRCRKDFRKTDAQQACKIDVNKASKLWLAFDRAGWFQPKYFTQYL
ncbi:hypothetical protein LOZ12_003028 [Ophidiomyces ophidiicola]|uniref:uncharacterized protein n=1 Tax=Ophidiomyces ophidiicola TaxID=1387563 RepID=UPI0020C1DCB3|nr:uncharacterized protein LOZ57_000437 [Ophidiomyces ophidiicola]KAI1916560.1 hypothetical protein LOZ64_003309 [Ophidiomyces ophidiicola]KAI1947597.1 hypothetical protein LOZ62_002961 [Ophidiomyces ophidiicola]KAI1954090.1 hypothetical protein LOZ57_000437 [Ophidiomyces ophidiicola]KAI1957622.1 hypothetical protein LOZ59_003838 [Ophidiomyces ophidiicola]KAI1971303.1 hypothetical protein LOZ56_003122 [Ophidiomyces ophidiicola]